MTPGATDAELRSAYRRLVQLHHPDHNGGSRDAAHRFERIQAAYLTVMEARRTATATAAAAGEPELEWRLAALEREVHEARAAQAARAAQQPVAADGAPRRPTPEELGYVTTDDSFSKILADLLGDHDR